MTEEETTELREALAVIARITAHAPLQLVACQSGPVPGADAHLLVLTVPEGFEVGFRFPATGLQTLVDTLTGGEAGPPPGAALQ